MSRRPQRHPSPRRSSRRRDDNVIDEQDLPLIVTAVKGVVDQVLGERLEQVYTDLQAIREQFEHTVQTLDGNDHAILAELRARLGDPVGELTVLAEQAWERHVRAEGERIGLKPVLVKKKREVVDPAAVASNSETEE